MPPSTRRGVEIEVNKDGCQNDTVSQPQEQNLANEISHITKLTHRSTSDTSNLSLNALGHTVPIQTTIGPRSPTNTPSSLGGTKRTLKRTGPSTTAGIGSASTSNLLRNLGALKHPFNVKTTTNTTPSSKSAITLTQPVANVPSFMAPTTAFSRRFNLPSATSANAISNNHSNLSATPTHKKPTVSPHQSRIQLNLITKENAKPGSNSTLTAQNKNVQG